MFAQHVGPTFIHHVGPTFVHNMLGQRFLDEQSADGFASQTNVGLTQIAA